MKMARAMIFISSIFDEIVDYMAGFEKFQFLIQPWRSMSYSGIWRKLGPDHFLLYPMLEMISCGV
jgi:hypothetical protein